MVRQGATTKERERCVYALSVSRCIYEVRRNGLSGRSDIIIVDRGNRDFSTRACI